MLFIVVPKEKHFLFRKENGRRVELVFNYEYSSLDVFTLVREHIHRFHIYCFWFRGFHISNREDDGKKDKESEARVMHALTFRA